MWESSKNSAAFPDYPSMEMVIFLISVCEIAGLPKGRMIAHSPFFLTHTPMGPYVRDSRIPGPPDCYPGAYEYLTGSWDNAPGICFDYQMGHPAAVRTPVYFFISVHKTAP